MKSKFQLKFNIFSVWICCISLKITF